MKIWIHVEKNENAILKSFIYTFRMFHILLQVFLMFKNVVNSSMDYFEISTDSLMLF